MRYLFLLAAPLLLAGPAASATVDLRLDRLSPALKLVNEQDRRVVDTAIQLIQRGENSLALAQLAALTKSHPENSSVRVLTAYAMLQLGNLLGAFEEAKKAESSGNGNSYTCWFLAKVALLTGDKDVCKRELKHVKKMGDMAADAQALDKEVKQK